MRNSDVNSIFKKYYKKMLKSIVCEYVMGY
jgi:hypothetical protein